jgi:hypothetical protein
MACGAGWSRPWPHVWVLSPVSYRLLHPHPLCLGDGLWGWLEQAVTTRVGSVSSFLQVGPSGLSPVGIQLWISCSAFSFKPEMEFLDINLTKESSLFLHAIQMQMTSHNVWNMSLFKHFFKVLSLYLEARIRIRIRIKVKGKSKRSSAPFG